MSFSIMINACEVSFMGIVFCGRRIIKSSPRRGCFAASNEGSFSVLKFYSSPTMIDDAVRDTSSHCAETSSVAAEICMMKSLMALT